MNNTIARIRMLSLVLLSLAITYGGQTKTSASKTDLTRITLQSPDVSGWQTVSLTGKAIDFKLPPDWRKQESEKQSDDPFYSLESFTWANKVDSILIEITTFKSRTLVSVEEMVEQEFINTRKLAESKEDGAPSDVKRTNIGDVRGVFSRMRFHFNGPLDVREGIVWTGYRAFEGKAQEVEMTLFSNPAGQQRLQTVFDTFRIAKDR